MFEQMERGTNITKRKRGQQGAKVTESKKGSCGESLVTAS